MQHALTTSTSTQSYCTDASHTPCMQAHTHTVSTYRDAEHEQHVAVSRVVHHLDQRVKGQLRGHEAGAKVQRAEQTGSPRLRQRSPLKICREDHLRNTQRNTTR